MAGMVCKHVSDINEIGDCVQVNDGCVVDIISFYNFAITMHTNFILPRNAHRISLSGNISDSFAT